MIEVAVNLIVEAIVSGAAVGLIKGVAEHTVGKAYKALKGFFTGHQTVARSISLIEEDPSREVYKALLRDEIQRTGLAVNQEVLKLAKEVIEAAKPHAAEIAYAVNLKNVEAEFFKFDQITTKGGGAIVAENLTATRGGFEAGPINADFSTNTSEDAKKKS